MYWDVVEYSGKCCASEPSVECRGVLGFSVGRVREGVGCCGVCMVWWEGVSCGGCVGGVCGWGVCVSPWAVKLL